MPSSHSIAAAAALPILAAATGASAAEVTLNSRITAVTVFPSGAEVSRAVHVKLEPGEVTAILPDLPAQTVAGSLRVEGRADGKLEIGAVDSRRLVVPRADAPTTDAERKRLEDEIETVRDDKKRLEGAVHAAEMQIKLVENLANLPTRPAPAAGSEAREDWSQILGVIASGSEQAGKAAVETGAKLRAVDRHLKELERALASVAPIRLERTEVRVALVASAPAEADLVVRYQVPQASWTPGYDARLSTGTKTAPPKLELTRRATITQRTGEAWENVALELSTSRPNAGTAAPELETQTVDFEAPPPPPAPVAAAPAGAPMRAYRARPGGTAGDRDEAGMAADALQAAEERRATVDAAPFQAVFAVPGRLTVPATGDAKRVTLEVGSLDPALTVRATPKRDTKAYLYAKLTLPKGGAALLPGQVALFRDGVFAGNGQLPLLAAGEDHDLGFGADDNVRIKYAVTNDKRSETGMISTSKNDAKSYKITIRNLHQQPIAFAILDQIPVSLNQDIKVELSGKTTPSRRDIDDKRGTIAFDGTLASDEERVIEFATRVIWPAAKSVTYGN
jgi:uncharacterized protein (TIGR02231 family)